MPKSKLNKSKKLEDAPKKKKIAKKVNYDAQIDELIEIRDKPHVFVAKLTKLANKISDVPMGFAYIPNLESSVELKRLKRAPFLRRVQTDVTPASEYSVTEIWGFSDSLLEKKDNLKRFIKAVLSIDEEKK